MTGKQRALRPWLVMVTGEPGSGKTSLGLELAASLRVPFLSRDHVRGGMLATSGLWTNQLRDPPHREAAVDALVDVIETFGRLGVTSVIEFIVTPQRVEAFRRLQQAARCLVVLTVASGASARAEQRDRSDPLLNRAEVLQALGHQSIDEYVGGPARELVRAETQQEFDLPLLRVATTDGYDPALETIVDWIIAMTRD